MDADARAVVEAKQVIWLEECFPGYFVVTQEGGAVFQAQVSLCSPLGSAQAQPEETQALLLGRQRGIQAPQLVHTKGPEAVQLIPLFLLAAMQHGRCRNQHVELALGQYARQPRAANS